MPLRSTPRRRSVPLILTFAALGCAEPIAATARPVAGCYRLETAVLPGGSLPIAPLPDTVRLFDVRGTVALEDGHALLRAWPDSLRKAYQWSWWEVAKPDTLTLVFANGFAGARLALRPAGDGFGGAMFSFSDVDPAPAGGAVARLRPIACEGAGLFDAGGLAL